MALDPSDYIDFCPELDSLSVQSPPGDQTARVERFEELRDFCPDLDLYNSVSGAEIYRGTANSGRYGIDLNLDFEQWLLDIEAAEDAEKLTGQDKKNSIGD